MEEAAARAAEEEHKRKQTQLDLQDRYRLDLEREKMVTMVSESDSTNMSLYPDHVGRQMMSLHVWWHVVLQLNREKSGKLRLSSHPSVVLFFKETKLKVKLIHHVMLSQWSAFHMHRV